MLFIKGGEYNIFLMRSAAKPLLKIWTNNIATFSEWFRTKIIPFCQGI